MVSRSVLISTYISALPQYLVVPCTRGIRTPCTNNIPANLHASLRASGFGFVRSTKKETDTLLWCLSLFLVSHAITISNYGNFSKAEYLLALRLANKLADLRAANANPCGSAAGQDSEYRSPQNEKKHSDGVLRSVVTGTGIEPMFSAWEADVLTAWPTGLVVFSLSIILFFSRFVKGFWKVFLFFCQKTFSFQKIQENGGFLGVFG